LVRIRVRQVKLKKIPVEVNGDCTEELGGGGWERKRKGQWMGDLNK
jgi:hypothetical protein